MNEAETRAELIDPVLKACGWGVVEGSKILREYNITEGRIQTGGGRAKKLTADYVLVYKGIKLAVVEAKSDELEVGEGVAQAKQYAEKMKIETTYAANGREIYSICMKTGKEGIVANFLSPEELWNETYAEQNNWRDKFAGIPFEDKSGTWQLRYYQELAINRAMEAIANNKRRILLTLATGTGKTAIAAQISWKLFRTRWNLNRDGSRRPRILFLADRNILADQAFNAFSFFPEDALVRIRPHEIKKKGSVPTNGSVFFTIFQTFMSGGSTSSPTAGESKPNYSFESGGSTSSPTAGEDNQTFESGGSTSSPTADESKPNYSFERIDVNTIPESKGYIYILECSDGSFYTGSTIDLKRRMEQHNNGEGANHTKKYSPVKLIYYETFDRIDSAFEREKQLQNWSRAKKIALIEGDIKKLKELSRSRSVAEPVEAYFGEYPEDYFDFIIIDECHRGGANDESNWRAILDYFSPAVQLGLTATPKRDENVDTYRYFGEPVYIYSLKEGINDGFLTPFKVKRIKTTLDDYIYVSDDKIIEGDVEEGRLYVESDFNKIIEIKEREAKRVQIYLDIADQNEKAIIFCATQDHAAAVRDLVNQYKQSSDTNYCARVTANDGEIGEQFLREFQDNEKTLPTILTTSQKLSTGVDARNIRNIVLMRPINSMIEFKQIIGRGTRLFDGKEFFTIYDYVDACHHFSDPEWDGEPEPPTEGDPTDVSVTPEPCRKCGQRPCICDKPEPEPCQVCGQRPCICNRRTKVKIKLRDGKEREIQHMIATSFWSADGKPISVEEFLNNLFGELPKFFKSEEELRILWSNPMTRRTLLEKLDEAGFGKEELTTLQKLIDAEKSDLFDVLEYVFNSDIKPITREERVATAQAKIYAELNNQQREFIEFVLSKYIETGVEELDQEKLPILLTNKYQSLEDAKERLGEVATISRMFVEFQRWLYVERASMQVESDVNAQ